MACPIPAKKTGTSHLFGVVPSPYAQTAFAPELSKAITFFVLRPILVKFHIRTRLFESFPSRTLKIWSFSRIAQKIKKYSSFNFLPENLEKFRSTKLYLWWGSRGIDNFFLCRSSLGCTSMESCQLADLKYAIFSSTGCKTKKLPCS